MDHFRYIADLVGIEHVAFGPDTLYGDHVGLHRVFGHLLGMGRATTGPSFERVEYVDGLENPTENFANICGWLVRHGYDDDDDPGRAGREHLPGAAVHLGQPVTEASGAAAGRPRLARLGDEYFQVVHTIDPLAATAAGRDRVRRPAARPEPGRRGARRGSGSPPIEQRLGGIDPGLLGAGRPDQPRRARRTWPRSPARTWSTACGRPTPRRAATSRRRRWRSSRCRPRCWPTAAAVAGYLRRLRGLARLLRRRHRPLPAGRGRRPAVDPGRRAAGHRPAERAPGPGDHGRRAGRRRPARRRRGRGGGRGEAARIVAGEVRPAMRRLLACLHDELLPAARPDEPGRHPVRARRRRGLPGRGPAGTPPPS